MKKLILFLIPLLMILVAVSCTENPPVSPEHGEITSSEDLYDAYLRKFDQDNPSMTFEEFKARVENSNSLRKTPLSVMAIDQPDDWEDGDGANDYGTNLFVEDDDGYDNFAFESGFTFPFHGTTYTSVYVSANGYLCFEIPPFGDWGFPLSGNPPTIAVMSGDFNLGLTDDNGDYIGNIYGKTITTDAGDLVTVFTWVDVIVFGETNDMVNTFQIKLYEDGKIQYGYKEFSNDGTYWGGDFVAGVMGDELTVVVFAAGNTALDPVLYSMPDLLGENVCFDPADEYAGSLDGCGADPGPEPPANPIETIQGAKQTLEDLLAGDALEKKLEKALKKAIKDIEKSLDPKHWDGTELDPKKGKKVFDHLKKAVKDLKKFQKAKGASLDQKLIVEGVIADLVGVCRDFASAAIEAVPCTTGKCGKELAKAYKNWDKAQEQEAKLKWDKAINKYKKAWQHALKALKHWNDG